MMWYLIWCVFFCQAEDGIRDLVRSRGLGDVYKRQRFNSLPIIALTSLASEDDNARGLAAGVNEYQVKLDREKLLEGIKNLLQKADTKGVNLF